MIDLYYFIFRVNYFYIVISFLKLAVPADMSNYCLCMHE